MRRPNYIVSWPNLDVVHPAVLDHVSRQIRAGGTIEELRGEIEANGGTITRMAPLFEKPRPAIVRRALALHR